MGFLALTDLPPELLGQIIPHVLPEGFESLALTCKTVYGLCKPFLEHHNDLRSYFHEFYYFEHSDDNPSQPPIRTSWDLLTRIATEPKAARCIVNADLARDAWSPRVRSFQPGPDEDVDRDGPVAKLLASSLHLKQGGLDWRNYYSLIENDHKQRPSSYSHHAAVFLLTLLPNVLTLTLPTFWKPPDRPDKTDALLEVIIREASQPTSRPGTIPPSLSQLTTLTSHTSISTAKLGAGHRSQLHHITPFLALPHVRSFESTGCVALATSASMRDFIPSSLERARLSSACLDEAGIMALLRHAPCLRTLSYSQSKRVEHQGWDLCGFIAAVTREVGGHLEELAVSMQSSGNSVLPCGNVSMDGFKRLQRLELPLEFVMCNLPDVKSLEEEDVVERPLIGKLVPESVWELSLLSTEAEHHLQALQAIFHDSPARKESWVPALKKVHLFCPVRLDSSSRYREQCEKPVEMYEEADVILHLHKFPLENNEAFLVEFETDDTGYPMSTSESLKTVVSTQDFKLIVCSVSIRRFKDLIEFLSLAENTATAQTALKVF